MNDSYKPFVLPLGSDVIEYRCFFDELLDATSRLEVYKEKVNDSKLDSSWFMPTLQHKEALASSALEGTQATIDGVLTYQSAPDGHDKNLNEVNNYYLAASKGYKVLARENFSKEFFCDLHQTLMEGNVRKPALIGAFRTQQNYIGRNDSSHAITFVPPAPDSVPGLMDNLISYINDPTDSYRPLVRIAIIHAQFETIHPFMDGNGRVGRMLIPLYLFSKKQIDLPCFFVSEALERDKMRYYSLLNAIRYKGDWNEWIRFFLIMVAKQCDKYIGIVSEINKLYDQHIRLACDCARTANIVEVVNALYRYPITTAKQVTALTKLPSASVNRYLNVLVEKRILYTNEKQRNRTFFCYDLLDVFRL